MKTADYLVESGKTLNYDFNANTQDIQVLIHGKDGLVTEVGELLKNVTDETKGINFEEELGDIDWYQAIFMRKYPFLEKFFDITYDSLVLAKVNKTSPHNIALTIRLSILISELADDFKRLVFYGKPPKTYSGPVHDDLLQCYEENIISKMSKIISTYLSICLENNIDPYKVREINIAKLRKRHGETFNKEGVFNRDLKAEETAMTEKKNEQ